MKRRPKQIRTKLLDLIQEMSEHPDRYIRCPGKDFTRKRKLPFEKMIGTLLCLKGGNLSCELMDAFGCSVNTATSSAFIQQRDKIRHEALADLFHSFVKAIAIHCQRMAFLQSDEAVLYRIVRKTVSLILYDFLLFCYMSFEVCGFLESVCVTLRKKERKPFGYCFSVWYNINGYY